MHHVPRIIEQLEKHKKNCVPLREIPFIQNIFFPEYSFPKSVIFFCLNNYINIQLFMNELSYFLINQSAG